MEPLCYKAHLCNIIFRSQIAVIFCYICRITLHTYVATRSLLARHMDLEEFVRGRLSGAYDTRSCRASHVIASSPSLTGPRQQQLRPTFCCPLTYPEQSYSLMIQTKLTQALGITVYVRLLVHPRTCLLSDWTGLSSKEACNG